ncbi:MAG TPA: tetrahydrofolate dehydrogenase/cyclohydrolase catalytic domain-containing protein [Methanomassiliicoccales archaeon]|nr:tetrahydrofolate dehydrogenase/cyclohydrolase catalytic domain-containing protein [Methanomassiliicoccales archaeon]
MAAQLIDGTGIAAQIREELKPRIAALTAQGQKPGLAVILVGNNPSSEAYVRMKGKATQELGMHSRQVNLPANIIEAELLSNIQMLDEDPTIHGILVQTPLPDHIDANRVIMHIDPVKDADGFHPVNVGKMLIGMPALLPCTPHGIQELLVRSGNPPDGKHVVVVGRSNIVGKPVAAILMQKAKGANATVTVCHSGTPDLAEHTRRADILIAAMGRASFIKADMVRDGVVVIDVGSNRIEDHSRKSGYRFVGDVDFEPVAKKAKAITPVPGGVGPMTIAMLMSNTVLAAEMSLEDRR